MFVKRTTYAANIAENVIALLHNTMYTMYVFKSIKLKKKQKNKKLSNNSNQNLTEIILSKETSGI